MPLGYTHLPLEGVGFTFLFGKVTSEGGYRPGQGIPTYLEYPPPRGTPLIPTPLLNEIL